MGITETIFPVEHRSQRDLPDLSMGRTPLPVFRVPMDHFRDGRIHAAAIPTFLEPIGKGVGPLAGIHLQHDSLRSRWSDRRTRRS